MNQRVRRCGACGKVLLNDRRDYCDDDCKLDAAYTRERLAKGTKTVRKGVCVFPVMTEGSFHILKSMSAFRLEADLAMQCLKSPLVPKADIDHFYEASAII
jgi:hypothetical protein